MKRPWTCSDTKCVKKSSICDDGGAFLETGGSQPTQNFNDSISVQVLKQVESLSFRSLRVELSRRHLPTTGLRDDLRKRLLSHITSHPERTISVPAIFPSYVKPPHFELLKKPIGSIPPLTRGLESQPTSNFPANTDCGRLGGLSVERKKPILGDASAEDIHVVSGEGASTDNLSKTPHLKSEFDATRSDYRPVVGVLRLRAVWICGERNMRAFWRHVGPLGKANLSRSSPCYFLHDERSWRGRAARQLLELEGKSDDTPDDYQTQKVDPPSFDSTRADLEHLQLTLVEAYYAAFVKKALILQDETGNLLTDAPKTWHLFCSRAGARFPATFVVYCRYRAVGWIPRSGLKYGTDWVLYPASAKRHTHSPFCVVLRFRDGEPKRLERTWVSLQNRIRLVKNVSKTLIIAEVFTTPNVDMSSDIRKAFRAVSISELTLDRWVP